MRSENFTSMEFYKPHQVRHFVGPDRGTHYLQKLSIDDTGR